MKGLSGYPQTPQVNLGVPELTYVATLNRDRPHSSLLLDDHLPRLLYATSCHGSNGRVRGRGAGGPCPSLEVPPSSNLSLEETG